MSVLAKKNVVYFKAPLSISETKVTVSGSWSAAAVVDPMNANHLFQMRLHVWKQQFESKVATACVDWVITRESSNVKHFLVLKFDDGSFGRCLQDETFGAHIQSVLDGTDTIVPVAQAFNNCIRGRV